MWSRIFPVLSVNIKSLSEFIQMLSAVGYEIWQKLSMPSIVTYVCMTGELIFRMFSIFGYSLLHGCNNADTAYNSIQSINQSINHSFGVAFVYKTLSIYSGMTLQYLHYIFFICHEYKHCLAIFRLF